MKDVKQSCLSNIEAKYEDDQEQLFSFVENEPNYTKIAVVRKPMYGIENVTDETISELAPPISLLEEFWDNKNSMSHNEVWEYMSFGEKYKDFLFEDEDAQKALRDLTERIENGERVTLVCYEKHPKNCHRHVLKEIIERKVNNDSKTKAV